MKGQAVRKREVSCDLPPLNRRVQPKFIEGIGSSDEGEEQEGFYMEGLEEAGSAEKGWQEGRNQGGQYGSSQEDGGVFG